jgi:hypothetical protein
MSASGAILASPLGMHRHSNIDIWIGDLWSSLRLKRRPKLVALNVQPQRRCLAENCKRATCNSFVPVVLRNAQRAAGQDFHFVDRESSAGATTALCSGDENRAAGRVTSRCGDERKESHFRGSKGDGKGEGAHQGNTPPRAIEKPSASLPGGEFHVRRAECPAVTALPSGAHPHCNTNPSRHLHAKRCRQQFAKNHDGRTSDERDKQRDRKRATARLSRAAVCCDAPLDRHERMETERLPKVKLTRVVSGALARGSLSSAFR